MTRYQTALMLVAVVGLMIGYCTGVVAGSNADAHPQQITSCVNKIEFNGAIGRLHAQLNRIEEKIQ